MPVKKVKTPLLSLRSVLILIDLLVLLLPALSFYGFRIYENELVRKTETELISQSAVIAASYTATLEKGVDARRYGTALTRDQRRQHQAELTPIRHRLNLFEAERLPPRPSAQKPKKPADPAAASHAAYFSNILKTARRTTFSAMKILDYNGTQVAGATQEQGLSFAHLPEVAEVMETASYTYRLRERPTNILPFQALASVSRSTNIRLFTVYPIVAHGRLWGMVYISRTPENLLNYLYDTRYQLAAVWAFLLSATLLLGIATSLTVSRPLSRLIKKNKRIAAGDRNAATPLPRPGTKEVAILSRSLTDMAHKLFDRGDYIRQFAHHLSHEFKTPLTGIRGAAELMSDHTDMPEKDKKRFLENISKDSIRLQALVTRLLELAKADMADAKRESCDFDDIAAFLTARYEGKNLTLQMDGLTALQLPLGAEDAKTIFGNLCDNAQAHGAKSVRFSASHTKGHLEIRIANDGAPISPANREKIFTPFFTTRREKGGTGLGLEIIRSLLSNAGGDIALDKGSETCFVLMLGN